ncbi:MAG: DUF2283 domain-containing protein [Chloroflexi bacterium]|nr:DUF2283 domain-containing protein [Chloroflexota bacterium]
MSNELRIYRTEMISNDGRITRFAYDEEGDILELVFDNVEATCAIELTDDVLLRFDLEHEQAAGLTILDFSTLTSSTEIGPESFPVTGLADLPEELRRTVVKILTSPPVNCFLKLTCYSTTPTERIPLTYVERPPALAALAPAIP